MNLQLNDADRHTLTTTFKYVGYTATAIALVAAVSSIFAFIFTGLDLFRSLTLFFIIISLFCLAMNYVSYRARKKGAQLRAARKDVP